MREKIAELIRLHSSGRSQVEIAQATGIARSTVQDYLRRVLANGVTHEEAKSLSTAALLERLGKKGRGHRKAVTHTIDFAWVCTELKRKGVTRALLFQELSRDGKYQGSYQVFCRLLKTYLRDTNVVLRTDYSLLIIDEWMRDSIKASQARELLAIIDLRCRASSTLFVSQIPVADWHKNIEDPTLADAILDRVVHHALRLDLKGESMRKLTSPLLKLKKKDQKDGNVAPLRHH